MRVAQYCLRETYTITRPRSSWQGTDYPDPDNTCMWLQGIFRVNHLDCCTEVALLYCITTGQSSYHNDKDPECQSDAKAINY
jgi:hypothetical protein